ncbi:low specificity L-threonine aldolase [Salinadaptatus halalkaliphilus]|uniref:Low specificity L-threonine aldolase n=1 Tax=Salinadaptatus halalkaliphilus TaxID=2419781 RepID=A0A4S3TN12_9EURY|nr:GntG family PLP-dependent aldolase [Salinadaptatus halalkaliphilus]THE65669.1 low specificity L-threonine aldolase [Salinadaptatus halalkaliphilus]
MIDLRSDTVTKPDERMREAARTAAVGDDVYGEDPTVNDLERRGADAVGKEAAVFVPTGTMGNQIAAHVHTDPGQEVLAERESHVVRYELAGFAQHSSLQVRMLDGGDRGVPTPDQISTEYVEEDLHRPGTGLLCLENTHNAKGGIAIAPEQIEAAAEAARNRDVPVHLDGARVFNAAVALDVPVTAITDHVDSVMCCLSKGLGAPVGSMLAGSEEFVERARRVRKLFGGGMRQVGILAGPGRRALENVDDLATDHDHARLLADGLSDIDGLEVQEPETNIVCVDVTGTGLEAEAVVDRLEAADVNTGAIDSRTVRCCTHRDLERGDIETALERIETALAG